MEDQHKGIWLSRGFVHWPYYHNINCRMIYVEMLIKAAKNGTIAISLAALSASTGITVKQVRTALKSLVDGGELEIMSNSGGKCKPAKYQISKYEKYVLGHE